MSKRGVAEPHFDVTRGPWSQKEGSIRAYSRRMDIGSIAAIPSALQSATGAIARSGKALEKDANVVARSTAVESRDTLNALLDSRQQLLYTRAAAKLISASDEMMKSLIDIRA
jgi:hypothetical protein